MRDNVTTLFSQTTDLSFLSLKGLRERGSNKTQIVFAQLSGLGH